MSTVHAEYIHAIQDQVDKAGELTDAVLDDFMEKNPDWEDWSDFKAASETGNSREWYAATKMIEEGPLSD